MLCEMQSVSLYSFSQSFCRMILAGEVGLLIAKESLLLARKMGVTYVCLR